jgi:hypothetical protein
VIAIGVISAVLAALVPIIVLLVLNAREDRPIWQIALDVPAAISLDLILVLLLARIFVLDVATWIAEGIWILIALGVLLYKKKSGRAMLRWPMDLTLRSLARALLLGLIGLGISLLMSRSCAIWDRATHIPLSTSLRGQTAPFFNVYEPWRELFYHYGGDLYSANFQTYSFGILHASHTLSLTHDFCFFWLGVCVACVLEGAGQARILVSAVIFLAMLLSGPVTMLSGGKSRPSPYNLVNFICLSFRPHVPLAVLLMLPFVAVPLVRLKNLTRGVSLYDLLLPLGSATAILLITDEFSLGVLGFALGVLWLWRPQVFGKNRKQGAIFFAGLAACLVLSAIVFKGTLGPGAPHYPLKLVAPHSPGFYTPALSFSDNQGLFLFCADLLPVLGVFLGGVLLLVRRRDELFVGTLIAYAAMTALAVFLFSTLVYNGGGLQNHRFVTAPMLFGPMIASVWLLPTKGSPSPITGFPGLLLVFALGLGAATSFEWLAGGDAYLGCIDGGLDGQRFYDIDCRTMVGGGLETKRTTAAYIEASLIYQFAGCRPTFLAGPTENLDGHDLKQGIARMGIDALRELDRDPRFLNPNAPMPVVCSTTGSTDRACRLLIKEGACKAAGSHVLMCSATPEQRRAILGKRR